MDRKVHPRGYFLRIIFTYDKRNMNTAELIYVSPKQNNKWVRVDIDPSLKFEAEELIKAVGLTPTDVINELYRNKPLRKIKNEQELEEFFDESEMEQEE